MNFSTNQSKENSPLTQNLKAIRKIITNLTTHRSKIHGKYNFINKIKTSTMTLKKQAMDVNESF